MGTVILQNGGEILQFDVEPRVDLNPSWRISRRPIAQGNPVSDHAEELITPITFMAAVERRGVDGDTDRQRRVVEQFKRLAGKPLTMIIEGYGSYFPVMLESWPHSLTVQSAWIFEVTVVPVRFATQTFVDLPPERIKRRAKTGSSKTQKTGKPGKQEIKSGSQKEAKLKSRLAKLRDTKRGGKVASFFGLKELTSK